MGFPDYSFFRFGIKCLKASSALYEILLVSKTTVNKLFNRAYEYMYIRIIVQHITILKFLVKSDNHFQSTIKCGKNWEFPIFFSNSAYDDRFV